MNNAHKDRVKPHQDLLTFKQYSHSLSLFTPVKYERIKFLVLALKNAVEVYAWAPKPYHKFMAFKVSTDL